MFDDITRLQQIASKDERIILGLMSGTSLDGLDLALCKVSGCGQHTRLELLQFATLNYDAEYRDKVLKVFAQSQGDLQHLCLLNPWIGLYHAKLINQFLAQNQLTAGEVDLIASHGQTIFHAPALQHKLVDFPNATLQLGDGDHIAVSTGIITLSDFRQKHIAAGGQGAPLVTYGDYLQFVSQQEDRILLNIGGIANFTWLPKNATFEQVISSDVGPGNTILDAVVRAHFPNLHYDKDAQLASAGKVSPDLLNVLKQHDFFHQGIPKTTGPEVFNLSFVKQAQLASGNENMSVEDLLATLVAFTAETIIESMESYINNATKLSVYVSGGGIHNPLLMQVLETKLQNLSKNAVISSTQALGIDPDAKEAILFALLANECVAGRTQTFANSDEQRPNISMGKISFPN
ncbi:anhydro-N-acetylmuramic acid kinase [Glaciecola sp. 1036]|uniref:anhydro-N-acetylmuramic acid kinase n=1 Tax=Alteromonadaceae TaxID=72275 RepID=UPI003CFF872A